MWVGFESIDHLNYDITLKQENEIASSIGKINSELTIQNESDSVSQFLYIPKQFDDNQKYLVLGALCLSSEGVANVDDTTCEKLFNTENISDMQEVYKRLSQQLGYEYCYLIELHR